MNEMDTIRKKRGLPRVWKLAPGFAGTNSLKEGVACSKTN